MLRFVLAGALLLAPTLAQAQVAHADFDNFTFDNGVSMGGPGLWLGIKTTVPASFVATRVEVWTGEQTGLNTLSLWSHDAVNNQPLAPLGSGSWQMGFTNSWQGAPLATPVPLTTGQDVWIVWACSNGAQSSVQGTGAGAQPYRGSFNNGASWSGPFQSLQWKFRIWSGPAGHIDLFGAGCSGAAGTPRLSWFGLPMAGTSFDVLLDRAVGGTVAALILGDSNTNFGGQALPLSLASIGAPACSLLSSVVATLGSGVDPSGQAVLSLAIPANPALAGFGFYGQWFCLDLNANALGLTFSNGGSMIVGS